MKTNANVNEENRDNVDTALRRKIEERAYHLWLESGCGHRDHERYWLQAERELMEAAKHEGKEHSDTRAGKKAGKPH